MKNVVIVGRPNVGKSSLFNRIIRRRKAVVEELPGVTRDRLLHRAEWRGTSFYLTDTGGYIPSKKDKLTSLVSKQVELAIEEGDIILFTLDAKEGVTPLDKEIAISLRKSSKKVFVVVNKVDNKKRQEFIYDFFNLGFDDIFPVSSIHGLGIADLLDKVVDLIKQEQEDVEEIKEGIKIAIVGKPNVGKSSFFNKIINKERVIVDENPGTTRDAIDTELEFEGEKLTLIDTAGIRRKPKIKTDVEYYTVKRAIDSLVLCDVALVMVDGSTDLTRQDKRLITLAGRTAGCVIILLNKIDLVPKRLRKKAVLYFQNVLRYLPYLLLLPISAKNGEGVYDAIRLAIKGYKQSSTMLDNDELNKVVSDAVSLRPHKRFGKRRVFITGVKQVSSSPPVIIFYTNFPEQISNEYTRYLEKKIREAFPLDGIPLVIRFRKKKKIKSI